MSERASMEELLEFANKVREAGGGNPLDALMPAVPEDMSQCLIAKNLNFNCTVGDITDPSGKGRWVMAVIDEETRNKIADALNLERVDAKSWPDEYYEDDEEIPFFEQIDVYGVALPERIGRVASDFDQWSAAIKYDWDSENQEYLSVIDEYATEEDIQYLRDFWPYVNASIKESFTNATFVNDKGELVL